MSQELRQIVEGFLRAEAGNLEASKITKKAGDIVFNEGDKGHFMFLVEAGRIDIMHNGTTLESVEAGGVVGEMALVDPAAGRRSAAAQASTDAILVPINQRRFRELVQRNPDFALEVMKVLARRIREMNERMG